MTNIDEQGRTEPPHDGDELSTALGFLDFQRATLEWKCQGLDAEAMRVTVGRSRMTLGGLLKHLAGVEDYWFTQRLLGLPEPSPWNTVDWGTDRDWEWNSAADDTPEYLLEVWHASVERSRQSVLTALADGGLDRPADLPRNGIAPNMRWIVIHMIEEYARHNGHADLIREAVDGATGE